VRVVLQRVSRASVRVDGREVSSIGPGLLLLVGIGREDGESEVEALAEKVVHLRIFADVAGKMNRSLLEVGGHALVVSQFTLYGDVRKGRRPSWTRAAEPSLAAARVERFAQALASRGVEAIGRGTFGAHMEVELVNDGPVTIVLDGGLL
jgi:D-aminoacyl-tRNA deacylase